MRTLPFGVFYAVLTMQLTATGAEVAVGMAEADLLTAKGEPQATMMAGEKTIYRWSDMVVLLDHARVVSIDPRDLQKEQAEQKRRAQMLAEIARKAEIARQQAADAAKKQEAEEERLRPQRELDALKAKVEKLEQDKKAEAAEFTATIRRLEQEIGELSYKIEQGCEERPADCRVHMDYNSGTVAYFREDTGELVTSRSMTPEERQTSLPVAMSHAQMSGLLSLG